MLSHSTTIQCNSAGQPTSVQDALGHTASFAYQGYDLQSVTDPLNRMVNYAVDTLGCRIATRDPLGDVTLTQYDTNDRVTAVTDALNRITALSYDGKKQKGSESFSLRSSSWPYSCSAPELGLDGGLKSVSP